MSERYTLSRRKFLKMVGLTVSATALGACAPQTTPTPTIVPTATAVPPQPTPTQPPPTATPIPEPTVATSPITPEMVLVEAGSFEMGSMSGNVDEQPVHKVEITRSFYIGKYEVTFEEFDRYCDDAAIGRPDDSGWGRGKWPVKNVTWYDVVAYCNWLSEKEALTPCYSGKGKVTKCDFSAKGYRLPTEAEWEYAARGGSKSQGYQYAGSNTPEDVAWYFANSGGTTHPVGLKQPNELGLYDMSGNIYEWCWDWYAADYYTVSPSTDPLGPPPPSAAEEPWGLARVRRSTGWGEEADYLRNTYRSFDFADYAGSNGFRLVRNA